MTILLTGERALFSMEEYVTLLVGVSLLFVPKRRANVVFRALAHNSRPPKVISCSISLPLAPTSVRKPTLPYTDTSTVYRSVPFLLEGRLFVVH